MMNFPGVIAGDAKMLAEIAATQRAGKTVGGHYASPDLGLPFHAYVAGGPADDHEGTRAEDAIARVRQGMRAMLRLGSAWYDVAAQIKAVTEARPRLRATSFCAPMTAIPARWCNDGHMNRVVRHAIAAGAEADHRDPDGDAQHRPAFRAGARARLDRAGPPRRPDPHLGPGGAAHRDGHRPRRGAWRSTASSTADIPPSPIRQAPRTP